MEITFEKQKEKHQAYNGKQCDVSIPKEDT